MNQIWGDENERGFTIVQINLFTMNKWFEPCPRLFVRTDNRFTIAPILVCDIKHWQSSMAQSAFVSMAHVISNLIRRKHGTRIRLSMHLTFCPVKHIVHLSTSCKIARFASSVDQSNISASPFRLFYFFVDFRASRHHRGNKQVSWHRHGYWGRVWGSYSQTTGCERFGDGTSGWYNHCKQHVRSTNPPNSRG